MRISLFALIVFLACCSLAVHAQTPTPGPAIKFALVDTEAFGDETTGIKRLIAVGKQIDAEFKARRDEIATLKAKYDSLVKTINDTQKVADQKTLAAQADQAEAIKSDIERKQQDGQKALEKRNAELSGPVYQDIGNELKAFAKARGLDVLFDVSKMQGVVMVVSDAADITAAFVADYNAKHPAVPAKTP